MKDSQNHNKFPGYNSIDCLEYSSDGLYKKRSRIMSLIPMYIDK